MTAEVIRTGSVIVRDVNSFRADAPSSGSEPALRDLAAMLREHDEWTFEVQVHTDEGSLPRSTPRDRPSVRSRSSPG